MPFSSMLIRNLSDGPRLKGNDSEEEEKWTELFISWV